MADIPDMEEDVKNDVHTPATMLGEEASVCASLVTSMFVFASHSLCSRYSAHDVVIDAANVAATYATGKNMLYEKKDG